MVEWLQQFTPEQIVNMLIGVGWRMGLIIGGTIVLAKWADAFKAKWSKP